MTIKVHGSVISTATQRVLATLHEKNLEFDFVNVNMAAGEHKKETFISLNPFGQVPAFADGDLKLFESRAITNYIAHAYANQGNELIISDPKKMAIVSVWMEVEAHQYDPAASKLVYELLVKPMFGMTGDEDLIKEQEDKLAKVLDIYETRLSESKFLGGDSFSLADLHHLPTLNYLMGTRVKTLYESRPHVKAWCGEILAKPSWVKAVAK